MKINRKKDQKNGTVEFPTAFQVHGHTRKLWVCSRTASQLTQGREASLQTLGWAKPSGAAPQLPQPVPSRGEKGPSPGSTQGRGCIWSRLQAAGTRGTALSRDSPQPSFWREVRPHIWSCRGDLKLLKHFTKYRKNVYWHFYPQRTDTRMTLE